MQNRRTPAYYAVARGILDHPLFAYGINREARLLAWLWLIETAAWKPRAVRHYFGVTHLERGQLSVTSREMAIAWRWTRSRVDRFLARLEQEGMIVVYFFCSQRPAPRTAPRPASARRIITICNYEKFQTVGRRANLEQRIEPRLEIPQLPGIIRQSGLQQSQPPESIESKLEAATQGLRSLKYVDKSKPQHGARNRKAGVRWWDYATVEWKAAVEVDREMRGTETYPVRYRDGRGNWFKERGEAEWREWGRKVSQRR